MTKGFHKKKSKRILARTRYKIEKKVREHHRKLRRESKKIRHKRKRKDPGIPNSAPFKIEMIEEINDTLEKEKLVYKENKRLLKAIPQSKREIDVFKMRGEIDPSKRFENLKKQIEELANKKQKHVEKMHVDDTLALASEGTSGFSKKTHYKEFKKVIEASDVIIQVLDARDPLGTRCPEIEEAILKCTGTKRLILLLNKVDLIPKENLEAWLKYLRKEYPTVPFKASKQNQKNLSRDRKSVFQASETSLSSLKCFGISELMELLKNYCRNQGVKTAINVGVVGFPNVGKSSLINSLKGNRACNVGGVPGITKKMQEIYLDKHIKLLDSPGVIYANSKHFNDSSIENINACIALKNGISADQIDDPLPVINAIISRVKKNDLLLFYNIADFNDAEKFLYRIAHKFGMLKKGGIPEINAAAKKIINDWNKGKIRYHSEPPETFLLPQYISGEMSLN